VHPPVDFDGVEDFFDLVFPADHPPAFEQGGDLIQTQGVPLDGETALDSADPVRFPEVGLRSGLIQAVNPPDQALDFGDPIKDFTGDMKRRLQCCDSII
jgi:hypothetical protein